MPMTQTLGKVMAIGHMHMKYAVRVHACMHSMSQYRYCINEVHKVTASWQWSAFLSHIERHLYFCNAS